jgi:dephospho-CoA kinase
MVIGITGGYCTGKSQVARIFSKFGAEVIDLDKLAHKTLEPHTKIYKKIIKEFGKDILVSNRINHFLLAQKVFDNKKRLAKLNSIIHPVVVKQMLGLRKKFSKKNKVIVVEAPLLFEAGLKKYFDYIVVVKTDKDTQIRRAIKKTGFSREDVLRRINSQWPIGRKISQADFVIDNSKNIIGTNRQVREIWEMITWRLKWREQ